MTVFRSFIHSHYSCSNITPSPWPDPTRPDPTKIVDPWRENPVPTLVLYTKFRCWELSEWCMVSPWTRCRWESNFWRFFSVPLWQTDSWRARASPVNDRLQCLHDTSDTCWTGAAAAAVAAIYRMKMHNFISSKKWHNRAFSDRRA